MLNEKTKAEKKGKIVIKVKRIVNCPDYVLKK